MQKNFANYTQTKYEGTEFGFAFEREGIIRYEEYQFDYGYTRFIYKREFLIKNDIWFPDYRRFQDPPFFIKAMIAASEFYAVSDITYVYRRENKVIEWNQEKIAGLLGGLRDNLVMANNNDLEKLFRLTMVRLTIDCRKQIVDSLKKSEADTIILLAEIARIVRNSRFADEYEETMRGMLFAAFWSSNAQKKVLKEELDNIKKRKVYVLMSTFDKALAKKNK